MSLEPLISVVIPCYNQSHFLPQALGSIMNQSYSNWECIIVNDGSSDNTEKVALKWCKKDNRFRYFRKENEGLSSARNLGLRMSKGRFIQFLDSDDKIHLEKFSISLQTFKDEPNAGIVVSNFCLFKDEFVFDPFCCLGQDFLNFRSVLYKWDVEFTIPIHCAVFNLDNIKTISFNEDLKAKEDWLMWLELFKNNTQAIYINKTLAFYRRHADNMTKKFDYINVNQEKVFIKILDMLENDEKLKFSKHIIKILLQRNNNLHKQIQALSASSRNTIKIKILRLISLLKKFTLINYCVIT